MRFVLLVKFCWFLSISALSQQNAVVIYHSGEFNNLVAPVIITEDSISDSFCKRYFKLYGRMYIKSSLTLSASLDTAELRKVNTFISKAIIEQNDTSSFRGRYGSFDFMYFREGNLIQKKSVNNLSSSVEILHRLQDSLYLIFGNNYDPKYEPLYDAIGVTIDEFERHKLIVKSEWYHKGYQHYNSFSTKSGNEIGSMFSRYDAPFLPGVMVVNVSYKFTSILIESKVGDIRDTLYRIDSTVFTGENGIQKRISEDVFYYYKELQLEDDSITMVVVNKNEEEVGPYLRLAWNYDRRRFEVEEIKKVKKKSNQD